MPMDGIEQWIDTRHDTGEDSNHWHTPDEVSTGINRHRITSRCAVLAMVDKLSRERKRERGGVPDIARVLAGMWEVVLGNGGGKTVDKGRNRGHKLIL